MGIIQLINVELTFPEKGYFLNHHKKKSKKQKEKNFNHSCLSNISKIDNIRCRIGGKDEGVFLFCCSFFTL